MVAVVSILVFDAIVIGGYSSYKIIKKIKKKRALKKEKLRKTTDAESNPSEEH